MATQLNSDKPLNNTEGELTNQPENKEEEAKNLKKKVTGAELHNHVPKHSNHGRTNSRTFGIDHEPGSMR